MLLLPDYVNQVIEIIEAADFEAFAVGGCVRDLLRGASPSDYDIASDCPADRISGLFEKTVETGLRYGTVTILYSGKALEVTRYRVDGQYTDSRHPESVTGADTISEDLARRDFTINAMAYNPRRGLIDPFGGAQDLAAGIIRCAGDPEKRFSEDALRIMRAFRFSAQLGFEIEKNTLAACKKSGAGLENISTERIFSELMKLLSAPRPSRAGELISSGIIGFTGLHGPRGIPEYFDELPNIRELRAAALCYICGADPAEVFTALKSDNILKKRGAEMLRALKMPLPARKFQLKRAFAVLAPEYWEPLLLARKILLNEDVSEALASLGEIIRNEEPWEISGLAANGRDLNELGFRGAEVGNILNRMLEHVIEHPGDNTKNRLMEIAKPPESGK